VIEQAALIIQGKVFSRAKRIGRDLGAHDRILLVSETRDLGLEPGIIGTVRQICCHGLITVSEETVNRSKSGYSPSIEAQRVI
jgi:hypothetical protein